MFLLFDIGGTKMRLALSPDRKKIGKAEILETPAKFLDALIRIKSFVDGNSGGRALKAGAGGIAGIFDFSGRLLKSPNLLRWTGKNVREEISGIIKAPIFVENDAAIAGLGETIHGAGQGKEIVAYLTVSTGVGGARIVSGRIDRRASGFEPGHQIIVIGGDPCSCGGLGHLEAYVSGNALSKKYGMKSSEIFDSRVWEEAALKLAIGLHNTITHWSPDMVILGGPMILKNPGIATESVQKHLKQTLSPFFRVPVLKKAQLKDTAGLIGSLEFLKQNMK